MQTTEESFKDILPATRGYWLSQVQLNLANPPVAVFTARLNGPPGATVWARAWLSTAAGTLAESASPPLKTGDDVRLEVTLKGQASAKFAYMRIESAPLKTEHVVGRKLTV